MKSLFIVNPRSGIRRRGDVAAGIRSGCAALASAYDIITCEAKEQLDEIVRRAGTEGFEVVYAVGGDGTVHEVAKRLIGTELALGIIPTGSGNGLARHLGIPMGATAALAASRDGTVATIDTATVNGLPYVGVMGIGLDAEIAERFAGSSARGLRTYVWVGLRTFAQFGPQEYEIEIDGTMHRQRAFLVAVANSSQYGNNARIAPLASLQDGLLDVVLVEHLPIDSLPTMLVRLFNGTFHRSRGVRILSAKRVIIHRAAAGAAHVDGEPVTLPAELEVVIRPQSLRVLLPPWRSRV